MSAETLVVECRPVRGFGERDLREDDLIIIIESNLSRVHVQSIDNNRVIHYFIVITMPTDRPVVLDMFPNRLHTCIGARL